LSVLSLLRDGPAGSGGTTIRGRCRAAAGHSLLCCLTALSCAPATRPVARSASSQRVAPKSPSASPVAAPQLPQLELSPLPTAPLPSNARVEIDAPAFGDVLAVATWRSEPVRVRTLLPAGASGVRTLISFDGGVPREVGSQLLLGDLAAGTGELSPGPHVLLALLVSEAGHALRTPAGNSAHALIDFYVGERRGTLPDAMAPRFVCWSPLGTYYRGGKPSLSFEWLTIRAPNTSPLVLRVERGQQAWQQQVEPNRGLALSAPPVGDLSLKLADAPSQIPCNVTVNPTLEVAR